MIFSFGLPKGWLGYIEKTTTPCGARSYKRGGAVRPKYELFLGDGLWVCGDCAYISIPFLFWSVWIFGKIKVLAYCGNMINGDANVYAG